MQLSVRRQRQGISKRCRGTSHREHQPPCCRRCCVVLAPRPHRPGHGDTAHAASRSPVPAEEPGRAGPREEGGQLLRQRAWQLLNCTCVHGASSCNPSLPCPTGPGGHTRGGAGEQGAAPPRGLQRGREPGSPSHQQHRLQILTAKPAHLQAQILPRVSFFWISRFSQVLKCGYTEERLLLKTCTRSHIRGFYNFHHQFEFHTIPDPTQTSYFKALF